MRVAHIILAHRNAPQVLRLVRRLSHPAVDCFIHVDAKCAITDFGDIFRLRKVYLIEPRVDAGWACYSLVQAMLNSMLFVLNTGKEYDYIHFLSGQDYPLLPEQLFLDYLEAHNGYEFIGNRPYEESEENIRRMHRYHFNAYRFPGKGMVQRVVNRLMPQRALPFELTIRKGPQWMTLTPGAVRYILNFVAGNPWYSRYFRLVHAPDEFFFQTILYNSPFRERMRDQIFHHIDWSQQMKNPRTFTIDDLPSLMASGHLFARKFDLLADTQLLDVLDRQAASFVLVK